MTCAADIFSILETTNKQRKTAETLCNKQSSRSHSIFTLKIFMKEKVRFHPTLSLSLSPSLAHSRTHTHTQHWSSHPTHISLHLTRCGVQMVDEEEIIKTGLLNLVDLAGSECVGRSGAQVCLHSRLICGKYLEMILQCMC